MAKPLRAFTPHFLTQNKQLRDDAMNTKQTHGYIKDDFTEHLSEWITTLYEHDVRRICFRRFRPDNRPIGKGGFLSLYAHAVFTGAGNRGRDFADLQATFWVALHQKLWLSQILFWHHVLQSQCMHLAFDIHRGDLVSSLDISHRNKTRSHAYPLTAHEGASWLLKHL